MGIEISTYSFTPLTPVIEGAAREQAYMDVWHHLVHGQEHKFDNQQLLLDLEADDLAGTEDNERNFFRVMGRLPRRVTPRDAIVASSFVRWLGTKAGGNYLQQAAHFTSTPLFNDGLLGAHQAYMAAWAVANTPNSKHAALPRDAILANQHYFSAESRFNALQDIEAIEAMVGWLSTCDGQNFISASESRANMLRPASGLSHGQVTYWTTTIY